MKKTFIALFALSGMAMATSLTDYNAKISDPTQGYTIDSTSFSVAITLDPATLKTYLGAGQPDTKYELVQYAATSSTMTGVTTNFSSSNHKINSSGLYYRWGNNFAWAQITTGDNVIVAPEGVSNLTQIDWDNVAYAGLVYTFTPTNGVGTQTAFTLLDSDGTTIYSAYNQAPGLTTKDAVLGQLTFAGAANEVYYFNSMLSADDVKSVAKEAALAPEPATATLSLLALVGLAARRRRH